jgi:predicted metal-dependent phosphoesterase TrpH
VRFWEEDRELFGWSPEEAIDFIRADGALDVVAHPARYRDKERTLAALQRASGVEVYTSRHKGEVAAFYRTFAEENHKYWTASSDDHQNARYTRPPSGTPVATLERILGRALPIELIMAA